jgi:hypothetical protein
MKRSTLCQCLLATFAFAAAPAWADECKPIHADLVELRSTSGCDSGETVCFLGVVDGNQGLRGSTHFSADSIGTAAPTSPGSLPYSGQFEYRLPGGTLSMRETGVNVPGMVTAHQHVVAATGEYAGATGDFFVNGVRGVGIVTTQVSGTLCLP